ncbi:hypothetical protein KJ359_007387 [Pestalotiopsis sp. 9143b]|nr:hypothetical protein KJ359_007387 [Pestalotiopsis sp. 9143b]
MPRRNANSRGRGSRAPKPEKKPPNIPLEAPPPMHRQVEALINAAYPGKRLSNAWDDRRGDLKRRRTSSALSQLPWEVPGETRKNQFGQKLESPHYKMTHLLGVDEGTFMLRGLASHLDGSKAADDPIAALGDFARVPAEVRDMILAELLVSPDDIRVLNNWSLVYERSRPNLHVAILRACRVFHQQGVRMLYGANTFKYLIRDLDPSHPDVRSVVLGHVFGRNHVPLGKHAHLFRRIRLVVEANRMHWYDIHEAVPRALQRFLPDTQLHTVTVELPAQTRAALHLETYNAGAGADDDVPVSDWFRSGSPVLRALTQLNCQFIRVLALTHENECFEAVMDRRPHFTERTAEAGRSDVWSGDVLMLAKRNAEAKRSRARLASLWYWLRKLAVDNSVDDGPFRPHVAEPATPDQLELLTPVSSGRRPARLGTRAGINYHVGDFGGADSDDDYEDEGHGHDDDGESLFVN